MADPLTHWLETTSHIVRSQVDRVPDEEIDEVIRGWARQQGMSHNRACLAALLRERRAREAAEDRYRRLDEDAKRVWEDNARLSAQVSLLANTLRLVQHVTGTLEGGPMGVCPRCRHWALHVEGPHAPDCPIGKALRLVDDGATPPTGAEGEGGGDE